MDPGDELPVVQPVRTRQELLASGVTPKRLRGPAWRHVGRNFYVTASEEPASPTQRIIEAHKVIGDGGVVAGWAAAYLHGATWLDGIDERTFTPSAVDCLGFNRRSQLPVVSYRHSPVTGKEVTTRHGIAITTLLRTAFDGARWAASVEEAVVFVDAMLAHTALCLEELSSYIDRHARWTGRAQAQAATQFARPGVRSTGESRLRYCYQQQAGLPEPLINVPIFWGQQLLGIPDLLDPVSGTVTEFDGQQHRDREQHRRDNIREERFEAANLTVTRYDTLDMRGRRSQLIHRLQNAHARGHQRDRTRDRWTLDQPHWWRNRT